MSRTFFLIAIAASGAAATTVRAAVTISFSDLSVPAAGYHNGGPLKNASGWSSGGAHFNNTFDDQWSTWAGWSYSNLANTTTPGVGNQYAAYATGGGTYAVGFPDSFAGVAPVIDLPPGERPAGVRVANTTYTALSMRHGDQFAKKFGGASGNDPDFLAVTFTGYGSAGATGTPTGSTTFYLADFRFADNALDYIVGDWTTLDLSPLGDARSIALSFASSDVGQFGINTPLYVAIDDLTLVPEPASATVLAGLSLPLVARRRRR